MSIVTWKLKNDTKGFDVVVAVGLMVVGELAEVDESDVMTDDDFVVTFVVVDVFFVVAVADDVLVGGAVFATIGGSP